MDQLHLFTSLLLRGSIISKYSLKMSGKVREFNHDWRVATLHCVLQGKMYVILTVLLHPFGMFNIIHVFS